LESEQVRGDISALRMAAIPEAGVAGGDRVRQVAETQGYAAGIAALKREAPRAGAGFTPPKPSLTLATPPAEIVAAAPGEARDALARRYLSEETDGRKLSAIVFLTEANGQPGARVWTARATDDAVEDAIRDALKDANRRQVFAASGIDPAV